MVTSTARKVQWAWLPPSPSREELRDGDGGSHAHWTLRAVLVTMKRALGAAERVVFENDAEIGAGCAALVFRNEGSGQASHRHGHFKIVRLEIRSKFCHCLRFLKADFGMLRDPVAHGQKHGLHQLLHARDDFVTPFV